jgi:hypothetical protein
MARRAGKGHEKSFEAVSGRLRVRRHMPASAFQQASKSDWGYPMANSIDDYNKHD